MEGESESVGEKARIVDYLNGMCPSICVGGLK
jgi:hypothetical protein